MNSYRDRLWVLLGEWIDKTELKCVEYDSPLTFAREKFFDCILLMVHYTKNSECRFIFTSIDDLDDVSLYLELAILRP